MSPSMECRCPNHIKRGNAVPKVMAKAGKAVTYKGGRIYLNRGAFRAIREMPNFSTEKQFQIHRFPNVLQAWLHACKAIDDYKK